jgi:RNA polymerase sigma-70 factor, ECF subfamily
MATLDDMIALVKPLIPALRRYARALLRNPTAADDLVQDCLERAIKAWHQRRKDGSVRTWLFTILHNLAITRMQRNARRGRHDTLDDVPDSAIARPATQEDRLRLRDTLNALQSLPDEQRAVLLLISVEDLSYAETARVLDIPLGTVMSRLSRARHRLGELMPSETPPAEQRRVLGRVN